VDRRRFLLTSLASTLTAPLVAGGQAQLRTARGGFITPSDRSGFESGGGRVVRDSFTGRLRELGWIEGKNLIIESRYAERLYERLPALAGELVRLSLDVIFASSAPAALAAKRATTTIPVVFEMLGDPISIGLVSSLARPGANLTGISGLGPGLSGKRLELLKELVPGLRRVALLVNPRNVMAAPTVRETEKAAAVLGLPTQVVEAREPEQFEGALGAIARDGATAVIVVPDPMLASHARRIQALLLKHRLPAVHGEAIWLEKGALMFFGSSLVDHFRQAGTFVDKILRGAKPVDLPVEQSTRFELVINLKTAKALGLTIPPSLLARADQIIE
jgi:putative ABC transport system substrate-binding protein